MYLNTAVGTTAGLLVVKLFVASWIPWWCVFAPAGFVAVSIAVAGAFVYLTMRIGLEMFKRIVPEKPAG